MSERPVSQKLTHAEVGYESPSKHYGQRCQGCVHLINATPLRCEAVKNPIKPGDWCERFQASRKNPQWRKPVSEITDRAKRYRAQAVQPAGAKRCAYGHRMNPCQGPLGINHKDGDESNGAQSNLNWACKRHNAQLALYHKATGQGVRTRQYNPGADNLAQYVQAAVEHTRGAHDTGGAVIHATPKGKRKAFAREIAFRKSHRNPSNAVQLYADFHGKAPEKITDTGLPEADFNNHPRLAQLGEAVSVYVGEGIKLEIDEHRGVAGYENLDDDEPGWLGRLQFDADNPPQLASNPNGTQLFFVGGRQDIGAQIAKMDVDTSKELIDCGPCVVIEYETEKGFDDFRRITYFHSFAEESGEFPGDNGLCPRLMYNRVRRTLQLSGGVYTVKPDGITD